MSKEVNESLRKIAKGTFFILSGTVIGTIISFLIRLIIVRNLSVEDYGILSLVITIITIAYILGSLGLNLSIVRFISYHRAQKNQAQVAGTIKSALEICIFSSFLFFIAVFFGADALGAIFHNKALVMPLKIYSFAIPFLSLVQIFISIFTGLERADIHVIFHELLRNAVLLILLGIVFMMGFSLVTVVYSYLITAILVFILLVFYSWKKYFNFLRAHTAISMRKSLFLFSLPLIFKKFLTILVYRADMLILGYFKDAVAVATYNTALPLANILPLFLTSTSFLYLPLATHFFAKNQTKELKRFYIVVTKWISAATLPFFLILLLFPGAILSVLFGQEYVISSAVLMILSCGFFLHVFLGPNTQTLVVIGKPNFVLYTGFATVIVNILLNFLLIPFYGIQGAAVATFIALSVTNIIVSVILYRLTKILPFSRKYLLSIFISLVLAFAVWYLLGFFDKIYWWMLPIIFLAYVCICGASLIVTKSLDKEDVAVLLAIERKIGINLNFLKKRLKPFF